LNISYTKDATCDVAISGRTVYLQVTSPDDGDYIIGQLSGLSLTAETKTMYMNLAYPLRLKRGSTIVLAQGGTYTVGLMSKSCTIFGYVQDITPTM